MTASLDIIITLPLELSFTCALSYSRELPSCLISLIKVALKACPRRRDFYERIAQGEPQEKLDSELTRWLEGLDNVVQRMADFYDQGGHGRI